MAMASTTLYLSLSLLTFSLLHLPLASSISDAIISTAADTLSNAGFTAMSLTLSLISKTLTISDVPSATIFAPSDDSFLSLSSGQPPLSLLQLHFCPRFYSSSDLHSLSYGVQLPTFLPRKTLTITTTATASSQISINGVNLTSDSPLFDDGYLAIFPIERFFNPNFTTAFTQSPSPSPIQTGLECPEPRSGSYGKVPAALRSKGYSAMAALLELQLLGLNAGQTLGITVFAPSDDAMEGEFGNYTSWGRVFRRHVVPCQLYFEDLVGFDDGSVLSTFLKGFVINVTQSDGALLLNGEITVDFPDFFRDDRVVVHGLSGILSVPEMLSEREAAADSPDHALTKSCSRTQPLPEEQGSMNSNMAGFLFNFSALESVYHHVKKDDGFIDLGLSLKLHPQSCHPIDHTSHSVNLDSAIVPGEYTELIQLPHNLNELNLKDPNMGHSRRNQEKCGEDLEGVQSRERWAYVKVNMDGVIVGRKICLVDVAGYSSLALHLEDMFGRPSQSGLRLFQAGSEFVLFYKDAEENWRPAGDVPWKDFVDSVKRIRIVRNSNLILS